MMLHCQVEQKVILDRDLQKDPESAIITDMYRLLHQNMPIKTIGVWKRLVTTGALGKLR